MDKLIEYQAIINGYVIDVMENMTPDINPFSEDAFHMGHGLGNNLTVMYSNHPTEECEYIILIHKPTGKRIMVRMPK
jgi:hypothetical protein